MKKRKAERGAAAAAAQLRDAGRHPFVQMDGYVPLYHGEIALYRAIREAVPVVDAAVCKLVRLCGGVTVVCRDKRAQEELDRFLRTVPVGRGQRGLQAFLDQYLDSMLTCGRAVGEMVPSRDGRDIAALLCADVRRVEIREGDSPLDFVLCVRRPNGTVEQAERQELLLFTPFQPETGAPYGVSMLRSMPFLADILMKIFDAVGKNWDRMGNVRFAITCKDGDGGNARERCSQVAREWSAAMQAGRDGAVRDFVCAGDVDIRTIGADNQILDSEAPVRQILEQLVAKTGIPPFLLGLSWSSTERMSSQQADIMTSEIAAIRRSLEPVVERICELWLRLRGFDDRVTVDWLDVNLQDEETQARAALYQAQARALETEEEKGNGDL